MRWPPPQLPRDAPVLNVTHPAEVHVFVLLRHELDLALFDRFHRHFGQRRGAHVPLVGQHRLDHHAAAIAVRHRQVVRFDLVQQAQIIEGGNHRFTRREALQATELGRDLVAVVGADFAQGVEHFRFLADVAVEGQNVDHRQAVAFADFVVVEIVRRG